MDWGIPEDPAPFVVVATAPGLVVESFRAPRFMAPSDFGIAMFSGQQMRGTPLSLPDKYLDSVSPMIRGAFERMWVQQHILGEGESSASRLRDAVGQCPRARGDVRLSVSSRFPESWDSTEQTLEEADLIERFRANILDSFTHSHNKGVLVDGAVVESSTYWSEYFVHQVHESRVRIHLAEVTGLFVQLFDNNWRTCRSVATADSQAASFAASVAAGEDTVYVDAADRI